MEKDRILSAWASGVDNVAEVLPTGAGKTVLFSSIVRDHIGAGCVIAHRQELVCQISLALCRNGVRHRIIGPKNVIKLAVALHMIEVGQSTYDPNAVCAVAGVDTLVLKNGTGHEGDFYYQKLDGTVTEWGPRKNGHWPRRGTIAEIPPGALRGKNRPKSPDEMALAWAKSVTLWVMDEAHHTLRSNKWGKAVRMFPNAKGLGVTATPVRADGKGLGANADGVFHKMFVGPSMRDLINMGFLTDYRVFAPQTQIDFSDVTEDSSGDFNSQKLAAAVQRSQIVGDVVEHYKRIAPGKLGITFATDVATATEIARKFNQQGVPAAVVSAKTPDAERVAALRRFKNREIMQLINVDLFGEGFDLPAIEVVSMARPTKSFSLFAQQFGRALRIMDGKTEAIIIDHVGNIAGAEHSHGLPDAHREWDLERPEQRRREADTTLKTCRNTDPLCFQVYERIDLECPHCGFVPEYTVSERSSIEFVEGDLMELTPEVLAQMRGEVERVDRPAAEVRAECAAKNMPAIGQMAAVTRHVNWQDMQDGLRASITWWAGYWRGQGDPDAKIFKRFYRDFGVDILTAQSLKIKDAETLALRINEKIGAL